MKLKKLALFNCSFDIDVLDHLSNLTHLNIKMIADNS